MPERERTPTPGERNRSTAAAEIIAALEVLPLEYVQVLRAHARSLYRIAADRGELLPGDPDRRAETRLLFVALSAIPADKLRFVRIFAESVQDKRDQ